VSAPPENEDEINAKLPALVADDEVEAAARKRGDGDTAFSAA